MRTKIRPPIAALMSGLLCLGAAGCTGSPKPAATQATGPVELGVVDMLNLGAPTMAAINATFTAKYPNVKIGTGWGPAGHG